MIRRQIARILRATANRIDSPTKVYCHLYVDGAALHESLLEELRRRRHDDGSAQSA